MEIPINAPDKLTGEQHITPLSGVQIEKDAVSSTTPPSSSYEVTSVELGHRFYQIVERGDLL